MADDKYKTWYEENKDSHNENRRSRYEQDPEYRARVQEQARDSARKRRANKEGLTRTKNGVEYPVLKMGEVCDLSGLTASQIRHLQGSGKIPKCSFEGRHRVYTQKQAELLKRYAEEGNDALSDINEQWEVC